MAYKKIFKKKITSKYKLYMYFFTLIFFIQNIGSQDFQPIGTVNPTDYIPAQKAIAESKNGMVTTQHFLATRVGEKTIPLSSFNIGK